MSLKTGLKHHVIHLRCVLSFPSVLSAASRRSLRERLQSLGESDRQMCHQVNQSDFGSSRSWAYRPSLTVCALVLQPPLLSPLTLALLYPVHPSLSCRCSLLSVSSFYAFHPLPFCEVPALISLMSASLYLLSFWFVLFWCGWLCFCPLKSSGWDPFQPEVPLLLLLLHKLTELKWPERMPVEAVAHRRAITL